MLCSGLDLLLASLAWAVTVAMSVLCSHPEANPDSIDLKLQILVSTCIQ